MYTFSTPRWLHKATTATGLVTSLREKAVVNTPIPDNKTYREMVARQFWLARRKLIRTQNDDVFVTDIAG